MYSPWYIHVLPSEYDSNGTGELSISAIGLSGEITSSKYDFGYINYDPGDFSVIDGVCTFTSSAELTCPKANNANCLYSVKFGYQDGRTLVFQVIKTNKPTEELIFFPVRNYM